jgi:hypothetical protein
MRPSFTDDDEDDGDESTISSKRRLVKRKKIAKIRFVMSEHGEAEKIIPSRGKMEYDVCRQCDGSGKSMIFKIF